MQEAAEAGRHAEQEQLDNREEEVHRYEDDLRAQILKVEQLSLRLAEKDSSMAADRGSFQATIDTLEAALKTAQVRAASYSVSSQSLPCGNGA